VRIRRLLDPQSGRFSAEATGTNLICSFPHRRGEFRVYPKLFPTAAENECRGTHRSFSGRFIVTSLAASAIGPGYFFASSKNFSVEISGSGEKNLTHPRHATDFFRAEVDFEQALYRLALLAV
jgi:hypothetical protein